MRKDQEGDTEQKERVRTGEMKEKIKKWVRLQVLSFPSSDGEELDSSLSRIY